MMLLVISLIALVVTLTTRNIQQYRVMRAWSLGIFYYLTSVFRESGMFLFSAIMVIHMDNDLTPIRRNREQILSRDFHHLLYPFII